MRRVADSGRDERPGRAVDVDPRGSRWASRHGSRVPDAETRQEGRRKMTFRFRRFDLSRFLRLSRRHTRRLSLTSARTPAHSTACCVGLERRDRRFRSLSRARIIFRLSCLAVASTRPILRGQLTLESFAIIGTLINLNSCRLSLSLSRTPPGHINLSTTIYLLPAPSLHLTSSQALSLSSCRPAAEPLSLSALGTRPPAPTGHASGSRPSTDTTHSAQLALAERTPSDFE